MEYDGITSNRMDVERNTLSEHRKTCTLNKI